MIVTPAGSVEWDRDQWQQWYVSVLFSEDVKELGEEILPHLAGEIVSLNRMTHILGATEVGMKTDVPIEDMIGNAAGGWQSKFETFCRNVFKVVDVLHVSETSNINMLQCCNVVKSHCFVVCARPIWRAMPMWAGAGPSWLIPPRSLIFGSARQTGRRLGQQSTF